MSLGPPGAGWPLRPSQRHLYTWLLPSGWKGYVMTKGEIESAIRNAIIKFEQEFMGRGPEDVRAYIVRDLVVVRLKGVLTPAERQLAKTAEGVDMVKRIRQTLIAQGRERLFEQVNDITGAKALALYTDINAQIGEKMLVFTVDRDLEGPGR